LQTFFVDVFCLNRNRRKHNVAIDLSFLLSIDDLMNVIFFFRCRWNFQCSRSNRVWFTHETNTTFVEDRWFVNNCSFAHARLNSSEIFLCVRDRSRLVLSLCVILSHFLRIINDMSSTRIQYRVCAYNWFKCKSMKRTCVSISKIETNVTRKISKILRRHLFWMTASLLMIFFFFVLNVCQIVVS
jgi:hypothetical protein